MRVLQGSFNVMPVAKREKRRQVVEVMPATSVGSDVY